MKPSPSERQCWLTLGCRTCSTSGTTLSPTSSRVNLRQRVSKVLRLSLTSLGHFEQVLINDISGQVRPLP